jgi:mono/diheme cytochrome c family protein
MMLRVALCVLSLALVGVPVVQAQSQQGSQLYQDNCVICHKESGEGVPPAFPALNANEQLADPVRIVSNIRQGSGAMPPFPKLNAEQISAVANYIRNAWENNFGSVSTEDVMVVLEGFGERGQLATIWDGVFTEAQAKRGQAVYPGSCGFCHGRRLNGAPDDPDMMSTPPLARAKFIRNWEGRSLATLFEYTRATMPESNPGSLSEQEYIDVIAYMFSVGGTPAGDDELKPDPQSLARTIIRKKPAD